MNSELLSKMAELKCINDNPEDGYRSEIRCLEEKHLEEKHLKNKNTDSIGVFHEPMNQPPADFKKNNTTIAKQNLQHFISFMRTSEDMIRKFNVIEYNLSLPYCEFTGYTCIGWYCECAYIKANGYFIKLK